MCRHINRIGAEAYLQEFVKEVCGDVTCEMDKEQLEDAQDDSSFTGDAFQDAEDAIGESEAQPREVVGYEEAVTVSSVSLFIGGLPSTCDETTFRTLFQPYGTVVGVQVLPDGGNGDHAALVRFGLLAQAQWIVENLNGNMPVGLSSPFANRFAPGNDDFPAVDADPSEPPHDQSDQSHVAGAGIERAPHASHMQHTATEADMEYQQTPVVMVGSIMAFRIRFYALRLGGPRFASWRHGSFIAAGSEWKRAIYLGKSLGSREWLRGFRICDNSFSRRELSSSLVKRRMMKQVIH